MSKKDKIPMKASAVENESKARILADARAKVRLDLSHKFRVKVPAGASESVILRQSVVLNRSRRAPQLNPA